MVKKMVYCTKCGLKNLDDAKYCGKCGVKLEIFQEKSWEKRVEKGKDATCFGGIQRDRDYVNLISFAIFLMVLGIIFIVNRNVFSDFIMWIEQLTVIKMWIRPYPELINSAILFFGLMGVSNFITAGIRFMIEKASRKVLSDVVSGVALFWFAYLLNLYGSYVLKLRTIVAIELGTCGLLIILYFVVRKMFLTQDRY